MVEYSYLQNIKTLTHLLEDAQQKVELYKIKVEDAPEQHKTQTKKELSYMEGRRDAFREALKKIGEKNELCKTIFFRLDGCCRNIRNNICL